MKITLKIMRTSLFAWLCIISQWSMAQELIPMASWRSHFNYDHTTLVEKTNDKIFASTSHGLIFFDEEDQSINKLSKVDGLSDVSITALAFDLEEQYLVLGYQNGNLDLITSDGIQNLPILLNSDITESKTINHISFYEGKINLSTDFGLLVLTSENEVEEAYLNLGEAGQNISVRASTIANEVMYLATEAGVLGGDLTSGENLQDFNNWERFSDSPVYSVDLITAASINGTVYVASNSSLFKQAGNTWNQVDIGLSAEELIVRIRSGSQGLLVLTDQRVLAVNSTGQTLEIEIPAEADINDVMQDDEDLFWYADQMEGLTRLSGNTAEHMVLEGPLDDAASIKIVEGEVYVFPELSLDYSASSTNGLGYSIFEDGEWRTIQPNDMNDFSNITDAIVYQDKTLISSFGRGILDFESSEITDYTNSPLSENETGTQNTLVTGLAEDRSQNLWISNVSSYSLLKWDGADAWDQFNFGSFGAEEPKTIDINENEQIWMTLGLVDGRGVLAYDIESMTSRYLTVIADGLPSNQVHDVAFGKEEEIWFATESGLAYFPFSFGVIEDQSIDLALPVFEDNVLFENKPVYALAVDGGNRVWMGTGEGLWLFEENLTELIYHFEVDNSPLPSNKVIDLALHPETGELFINTDKGLVSYRTNATEASNIHQQVKIFPNPVLPEYVGWVGFSGLASDVRIKITTISGQLVREINASGGGASWDLANYRGNRVETGVYLIFSASQDGSETYVGKIAVIE